MQMRASEDARRDGVIQWRTIWKNNNGRYPSSKLGQASRFGVQKNIGSMPAVHLSLFLLTRRTSFPMEGVRMLCGSVCNGSTPSIGNERGRASRQEKKTQVDGRRKPHLNLALKG